MYLNYMSSNQILYLRNFYLFVIVCERIELFTIVPVCRRSDSDD